MAAFVVSSKRDCITQHSSCPGVKNSPLLSSIVNLSGLNLAGTALSLVFGREHSQITAGKPKKDRQTDSSQHKAWVDVRWGPGPQKKKTD